MEKQGNGMNEILDNSDQPRMAAVAESEDGFVFDRTRLDQVARLWKYLRDKLNFDLRDGRIFIKENPGGSELKTRLKDVIACNFLDLRLFISLRHTRLGNEPPVFFLKDLKTRCVEKCRVDGKPHCYCDGECIGDNGKCAWVRITGGRAYCYLVYPFTPDFRPHPDTPEFYRDCLAKTLIEKFNKSAGEAHAMASRLVGVKP